MENKSVLLVVLIAALFVTVAFQTVQLAALSTTGAAVSFSSGSGGVSKASTTGAASAPTSLDSLQSMVGGC